MTDIPVIEGLFADDNDDIALLGSHCTGCGSDYFPEAVGCSDPDCTDGELRRCELPTTGSLYSYSWQNYQPPPLFALEQWKPYAIGTVELQPGLRVLARLDIPREELRIGLPVELGRDVMAKGGDGTISGYVFRQEGTS
ncbi:OB-fold domain-containing protein [Altererythrobacter sp. SALINAS58]|uniref:Zn-ribbon domain-containing OB-fold protein n=1 Tax=Alteripontixanthobacter muriae TaxID=2705546 RepID=UPI0015757758|nr:OB-fold domain-containing protein [Alteripontixanthobacter muriae]NTZ43820.1 OB-fold domain-containing protein [Alteripontixanthobacter muriae]